MKSFDLVFHYQKKYRHALQAFEKKWAYYRKKIDRIYNYVKGIRISPAAYIMSSFLLVTLFLGLNNYFNSFFHIVFFEGEDIGLIKDIAAVEELIAEKVEEKNEIYDFEVFPAEQITYSELELRWLGRENFKDIKETIDERLTFYAEGYMAYIDDQPFVCLESKEKFDEIIEALKQRYTPDRPDVRVLSVTTAEKIGGEQKKVAPDEIRDIAEAFQILHPETIGQRVYLASRGESLSGIADNHNMEVAELKEKNPGLDGVQLEEGQEIYISAQPVITIISVEELKLQESIPYQTKYVNNAQLEIGKTRVKSPGKEGSKEIIYHVTRENGKEVSRQKNSERVVREAEDKVIEQGTKLKKAVGGDSRPTGQFLWPIPRSYEGGGRITNSYSGGHRGIDIYAGTLCKTPIVAADSGMVVAAQYYKAYGNIVVINHGNLYTVYAHLSRILVSPGQAVSRGGTIGYMGNTGQTYGRTGIHLHFEVRTANGGNWIQANRVNPLNYVRR